MGGKTKQSQRTKNNARPSSSGRSALLLSSEKMEPGVMNTYGSELPALFPTLIAPTIDPLVSPELQICIKKLNKKDPITKTKALQELAELVAKSNADEVVAALPSWAHFYRILTADPDRKVREATQHCHGAVVAAGGRRVAPHLKRLLPAWLQATHDEHGPARERALASLERTFPEGRLAEAIAFCKSEVLAHLTDDILRPAEAAPARRAADAEERAAAAARAAAGALRGLQEALRLLPRAQDDWLWERLRPLLRERGFWRLARHGDAAVRAAWLGALGGAVARCGERLAAAEGARALRELLAAAPGAEAWDCLLLFVHHVPDWERHLERPDAFRERLCAVLADGGWGDARRLRDALLPLFARAPAGDFAAFFRALLAGLRKKAILGSRSEREAWVAGLEECVRFAAGQPAGAPAAAEALRGWLRAALDEPALGRPSAAALAALLRHWLERPAGDRDALVDGFWADARAAVEARLGDVDGAAEADDAVVAAAVDAPARLLLALREAFGREPGPRRSVRFDGEPPTAAPAAEPCPPATLERFERELRRTAEAAADATLRLARERRAARAALPPLLPLLAAFDGATPLVAALDLRRLALEWLGDDATRCREAVRLAFFAAPHLPEPERAAMLRELERDATTLEWAAAEAVAAEGAARAWLRGARAAGAALATRALEPGGGPARDLLQRALAGDGRTETYLSEEASRAALRLVAAALAASLEEDDAALEGEDDAPTEVEDTSLDAEEAPLEAREPSAAEAPESEEALALRLAEVLESNSDETAAPDEGSEGGPASAFEEAPAAETEPDASSTSEDEEAPASISEAPEAPEMELEEAPRPGFEAESRPESDEESDEEAEETSALERTARLAARLAGAAPAGALPEDARDALLLALFRLALLASPAALSARARREARAAWGAGLGARPDLARVAAAEVARRVARRTRALRAAELERAAALGAELLAGPAEAAAEAARALLPREVDCRVGDFALRHDVVRGRLSCPLESALPARVTGGDALPAGELLPYLRGCLFRAALLASLPPAPALAPAAAELLHDCALVETLLEATAFLPLHEAVRATHARLEATARRLRAAPGVAAQLRARAAEGRYWAFAAARVPGAGGADDDVTGDGYFHALQAAERRPAAGGAEEAAERALRTRFLLMLRCYYAAHGADAALARDAAAARRDCGADFIVDAYYAREDVMLSETDVRAAPWSAVASDAAVCDYLAALVAARGRELPPAHWDFAAITLCNLLSSVRKSKEAWASPKVAMLARAVLELLLAAEAFVRAVPAEAERRQLAPHVVALPREWADVFEPELRAGVRELALHALESGSELMTDTHAAVLDALCRAVRRLGGARPADAAGARRAADALAAPLPHCYKFLAAELLRAAQEPLVLEDAAALAAGAGGALSLPVYEPALRRLLARVAADTAHVPEGERTCALAAGSRAHGAALGLLLLAELQAAHCRLARGDLRHHYTQLYRERKYAEPLLVVALRLLPAAAAARAPPARLAALFSRPAALDAFAPCGAEWLAAAACRVLRALVCGPGAGGVRGWRGTAPPRRAALLDRVVAAYVSPAAVREEFERVRRGAASLEDAEVALRPAAYELACTLTLEERPLVLRVVLARTHPLGLPRLHAPAPAAGAHWLVVYMGYQSGSLLDALRMWRAAVSGRVARAPQCCVCYCRLHYKSGRLPAARCRQCRNSFHTVCLRKWFATSNKSNCPLCRTSF